MSCYALIATHLQYILQTAHEIKFTDQLTFYIGIFMKLKESSFCYGLGS